MSARRAAVAINVALLAALAVSHLPFIPDLLRLLAAGALVLILPGLGWLGMWRRPLDAPRLALAIVGMSSLATMLGVGLLALGPGDPSYLRLAVWTVLFTNAGLLLTGFGVRLDRETPWRCWPARCSPRSRGCTSCRRSRTTTWRCAARPGGWPRTHVPGS
jgi:hypothetical protein